MRHPLAGPPRRPRRVRLADASLAAELRPALGGGIPVVVAPAPELDRVIAMMAESMPAGERQESYLEDGRVSPAAVAVPDLCAFAYGPRRGARVEGG